MELHNARILLTGGSKGIGKATALMLAQKGAKLAITARDLTYLKPIADPIGAIPIVADSGNPDDIEKIFDVIKAEWGGLDAVINNAGIWQSATIDKVSWELFERIFKVNVYGPTLIAQKAVELFEQNRKGTIVNICSTAALKGYAGGTVYSSSKFALRGVTQCLQAELRKKNIRVIEINPSEVPTALFTNGVEVPADQLPANKLSPNEIAHAIVSALEMDDRGFIPELTVWATNPF